MSPRKRATRRLVEQAPPSWANLWFSIGVMGDFWAPERELIQIKSFRAPLA
jgi:hypothetical protein